ncbi:DUF3870 domain-containing protein [Fundicoccus culcitae]|uniref:DUF3870 domain-containing protein n=1 Tax=Fundicoccus culcitae TaxID=2969821 RepID=A0ABY5P8L4_9LACT|nr:DUF3870 domain-containing protein [Fundicoccus culcitae]UUX35094.1 DUF3870 domain-containing protein [Fundicoccus culcitae]
MRILDTVFVSGYTRLPKGTVMYEESAVVGVMFEVNRTSHIIVKAECTFVTQLAQDYFRRMLVGMNFVDDLDEILKTVEANLFIPSAPSIAGAIKVAQQRYIDHFEKKE